MQDLLEIQEEVQNILHSSSSQGCKWRKCPRCGGDIFLKCDMNGFVEGCLACSHSKEIDSTVEFYETLAQAA